MKRSIRCAAVLALLAVAVGCDDDDDDEAEVYRATLNGNNEVPVRTTPATGAAEFRINDDNSIVFTLDAQNLTNVFAAHIHGPANAATNAGVVTFLFSAPSPVPTTSGRLAEGTITPNSTISSMTFDSLLVLIRNGNAYVNLHTNDNTGDPNSGPGDFPAGEIRGQILRAP